MTEPNQQLIAALKKQRSTNKAKLTNILKYSKQDHTLTNINELTTRLRRVDKLMEEFTDLEMRIFTEDPKEESDLSYEENYYSALSMLNITIRSKGLNQGVINLDSSHNETQIGEQSQVKLPKIHIPPFSGDYSEWQSFFDMFTTTIHEAPGLNPVQKFQYLKGLLRGEAAVLLRHITVTEANYIGALNKLRERYDRKKHIINSFIRTFIEQPVLHNATTSNLKRLMDTSDEAIRGLEALGHTRETRDPWLIYILLQKLDDKTKAMWAEHSADNINPEFPEFLKFLSRRIDTLETLSSTNKRSVLKTEVRGHVALDDSIKEEVEGLAAIKSTIYQCAMCKDPSHSLFRCSEFQSLNVDERKQFAKRTNRCLNCLSSSHPTFRCPSRRRCYTCGKKHNTLLHQEETSTDSSQPKPASGQATMEAIQNHYAQNTNIIAILPTAVVNAIDYYGKQVSCRALLDSGSQASFITESCAQRLRLPKGNARISVRGLGQSNSGISKGLVNITIKPDNYPKFSIEALVMSKITTELPSQNLDVNTKSYAGIKLADPGFNKTSNIDILIGADHFFNLLKNGQIRTGPKEPVLQNTVFGWIVSGQSGNSKCGVLSTMLALPAQELELINIDRSLRRFWEIESLGCTENTLAPEEEFCEKHFVQNTKRNHQGKLIVKLPFKVSPEHLSDSLPAAIQRLMAMERRFARDPEFAKLYRNFMIEYQQLNHMVEVAPLKANEGQFYLPHHGVFKNPNDKSKIRVVFDGSSKTSTGSSLNDCLAVGPTIQSSLYSIILRFREHQIAVSADVEKMYRQIIVSPEDTRYQRIVWRANQSEPIRHFQLSTVTYGLASSAFLATRALKQVANDCQISTPEVSQVIAKDIYVDDLMTGTDDEEEARKLIDKVNESLVAYGFHLKKWKSNQCSILPTTRIKQNVVENKEIQDHNEQHSESIKVLGIHWNPKTDRFTFSSQLPEVMKFTKRTVLSEASRLFDPLGWVSPVVINFKIFLQTLWGDNLDWDDPLPADKQAYWNKLRTSLIQIQSISIPRFIQTVRPSRIDIHGFCDASQSAYAAVVYFRVVSANLGTHVRLISSKTKVAPIKQQTLPRLELCAAVLLSNLITLVKKETGLNIDEVHAWTDSQIVIDWLGSHPRRWNTFVGNRTAAILSQSTRKTWKHVPSSDNPADCASRGLSPVELQSHALWWNGPNWLRQSPESWPPQNQNHGRTDEESKEKVIVTHICTSSNEWFEETVNKYSSFRKLQRVLAYIYRFVDNASTPKQCRVNGNHLRREELFHVTRVICKHDQHQFYQDDLIALQANGEVGKNSSLKSLNPFIDGFGILRVGGRLQHSLAPYATKHPIILHPKSMITQLILRDTHLENKHAGPSLLLSITRQEYWIPNGKFKSKEIVRKCVTCVKFQAKCQQQLMGSLPRARVELARPFLKTGVDYAGPIPIHLTKGRGQKTYKAYICLFICLSTKAVHLELVTDLSSDAFLGALKRFVARRGVCNKLHSDNGTNFVGADRKLKESFNKIVKDSNNISNYLSRNYITWHFIPPNSPHFGGLWEAAIKSTKFHLKRVIGNTILTMEESFTLLAEVESILNSRPLCVINDTDVDPLTPSHFLIGHPHTKIAESDITHQKASHLNRWQMVQQMSQHFWKRWYVEYLTSMQQRSKWRNKQTSVKIDDIALIQDKNLPVNQWLLGRVTQLHPGSDGLVRVVTLKTHNSEMKRPIQKLCLLPISRIEKDEIQN